MRGSMKELGRGGSIVLTASVAGIRAGAGGTPYSASKAAVNSLCQTSAWGLYKSGIRVNSVCPGLIRTGMTELLFQAAQARGKSGLIGQVSGRRAGSVTHLQASPKGRTVHIPPAAINLTYVRVFFRMLCHCS